MASSGTSHLLLRCFLLYSLFSLLILCCHSSSFIFSHPSFLKTTYPVKSDVSKRFYVRQVPGDGACLFHSVAVWISFIRYGKHYRFDWRMRSLSNTLRQLAVEMLKTNQTFLVENDETITNEDLLAFIAEHNNITAKEYLDRMTRPAEWGGGPEIIALCNHFKCPIHVYELSTMGLFPKEFCLQISAKFGSPAFDDKLPICILHADGRFPYIDPNKFSDHHAKEHFLALFPCEGDEEEAALRKARRVGSYSSYFSSFFLRSGYSSSSSSSPTSAPPVPPQSQTSSEAVITAQLPSSSTTSSPTTSTSTSSIYCNLEKCPEFSEDMAFFKKKASASSNTPSNSSSSSAPPLLPNLHSFLLFSKHSLQRLFRSHR